MSNSVDDASPDGQVAEVIVRKLLAAHLVTGAQAEELQSGLASGVLKTADWLRIVEAAPEAEDQNGKAAG